MGRLRLACHQRALTRGAKSLHAVLNGEDFAAHDGEGAARFDHLAARDQRLAGCRRNIIDLDFDGQNIGAGFEQVNAA